MKLWLGRQLWVGGELWVGVELWVGMELWVCGVAVSWWVYVTGKVAVAW